jgi:hypothetical protein
MIIYRVQALCRFPRQLVTFAALITEVAAWSVRFLPGSQGTLPVASWAWYKVIRVDCFAAYPIFKLSNHHELNHILEGLARRETSVPVIAARSQWFDLLPENWPFRVRVFRVIFPWLGGAEDDESLEVFGRPKGVHSPAGR